MIIKLNPNWASSLSYDFLDHTEYQRPIFVGRRRLLDPLVADIANSEKTGAYLISGYRGSGKTTLVIEALWRARQIIQNQASSSLPSQFVVVLNVSEISASLEQNFEQSGTALTIDPRRLLIALLRSLRNRIRSYEHKDKKLPSALEDRIIDTYNKAMAAAYTETTSSLYEFEERRTTESSLEQKVTAPYKLGAALLGLTALGLEAVSWESLKAGLLHIMAAGAALSAVCSLAISRKLAKSQREARKNKTLLEFDNSLQQLENDLKDIFELLYKKNMRTIVVLEELDKIDDQNGAQLDAVIRYFKNLFTQAPALFFFVTDKAYFDLVESRIREARNHHSYALEHTFFTHRAFVDRPNTWDCLNFLRAAIADERYQGVIDRLYTSTSAELDGGDREFGRFIRVLLFRAANHLFDLKNELRRYVRKGEETDDVIAVVIDMDSFPEDEAALAVFQELVESKSQAYAFGRGQAYANEVLRDYLYGVFRDMGSTTLQNMTDLTPLPSGDSGSAGATAAADENPPVADSLKWDEIQRISDAVTSLLTDLYRGGAFEFFQQSNFVWKRYPARTFKLERQFEKHEVELMRELQAIMAEVEKLKTLPGADLLLQELHSREQAIQALQAAIPVEEALSEKEQWRSRADGIIFTAQEQLINQVQSTYGFQFEALGNLAGEGPFRLRKLETQGDADRRSSFEVVVILGQLDWFTGIVPETPDQGQLKRVALIQVATAGKLNKFADAHDVWTSLQRRPEPHESDHSRSTRQGTSGPEAVSFDAVRLDEGLEPDHPTGTWGDLLGETLLFRAYWGGMASGAMASNPQVRVTRLDGKDRLPTMTTGLLEALLDWVDRKSSGDTGRDGEARLLWVVPPPVTLGYAADASEEAKTAEKQQAIDSTYELVFSAFEQPEFLNAALVHEETFRSSEGIGGVVAGEIYFSNQMSGTWAAEATRRLVEAGRLIYACPVYPLRPGNPPSEGLRDLPRAVGNRGRAVIIGEMLPEELRFLGVVRVEMPPM